MALLNPNQRLSALEFEAEVGVILQWHVPHGLLSRVPVFHGDTKEDELFATEIDHLIHFRRGGHDHLLILECKNQQITHSRNPHGRAPRGNEPWFFHYTEGSRDVRGQISRQAGALCHFLDRQPGRDITVECWVVHQRRDCLPLEFAQDRPLTYRAFNTTQFRHGLKKLLAEAEVLTVQRSPLLAKMQKGVPRNGSPHPPLLDALDYIADARRSIDKRLFGRFNDWFPMQHDLWAIKGAAGSGKSVLLAYSLAALATDLRILHDKAREETTVQPCPGFLPAGIPRFDDRKIHAFAMSRFQLDALQRTFENFVTLITRHNQGVRPKVLPVHFGIWKGSVPSGCNILAIDEAHDLDDASQKSIAAWHLSPAPSKASPAQAKPPEPTRSERYLIIALDRQQQIRQTMDQRTHILKGLNFRYRTRMMDRCYRSPVAAFLAANALLCRWYSAQGPMIHPGTREVDTSFGGFQTFQGGIGVKVEEDPRKNLCRIWIRNDSHPANHWTNTVDLFDSARELHDMLQRERLSKHQVLWLRFDGQSSDLADRHAAQSFEYHQIGQQNPEHFVDINVKGLEFPVVVIEGFPPHFNDSSDLPRMWKARRVHYICASRATGFLYFVLPPDARAQSPRNEVVEILNQLQRPEHRRANDTGKTWRMEVTWRPTDVVQMGDYAEDDGVANPAQA
jgi:hypothetical protein